MKRKFSAILAFLFTVFAIGGFTAFGQLQRLTVEVTLNEWSIDMPKEVPEGPVSFKVTNQGQMSHNFEVMGNNVDNKFDVDLKPGEIKTMDIDLDAGAYNVICPIGTHASEGMKASFTVTKRMPEKKAGE